MRSDWEAPLKANCHEFVDRSASQVLAPEADALEFQRALKVQACPSGDLHAIATDFALHGSTAGAELLRTKRVLTQPPRRRGRQYAVYRAGSGVLIDAGRREKHWAHVIHVPLAGSGDDGSAA